MIAFAFFVFFILFFIQRYAVSLVLTEDIKDSAFGDSEKKIKLGQDIKITAEVPIFLGIKNVLIADRSNNYIIYGNYDKGFSIRDSKTGEIIYNYNEMPGDGLFVNVPKGKNIILYVYY